MDEKLKKGVSVTCYFVQTLREKLIEIYDDMKEEKVKSDFLKDEKQTNLEDKVLKLELEVKRYDYENEELQRKLKEFNVQSILYNKVEDMQITLKKEV